MNLIKKISPILLFVSLMFIVFSWKNKNFLFLLLSLFFTILFFAINFSKIRLFLVPLISTFLTLSIIEGLLPLYYPNQKLTNTEFRNLNNQSSRFVEKIPNFGYRPIPGIYRVKKTANNNINVYDVLYTINEDGYRENFVNRAYEGFMFGGSFTFGEGLNDSETMTSYLLNEHGLNIKNVGVSGYGLQQALYNIQNNVVSINGINILVTFPVHALRSACKKVYSNGTPRYSMKGNVLVNNGVCPYGNIFHRVYSKSYINLLIKDVFFANMKKISDSDIVLYLNIVKEIYAESKSNNSKLLIAYIKGSDKEFLDTTWSNEKISKELNNYSDAFIDISLYKSKDDIPSKYYIHETDMHPSSLANKLRAQMIAIEIKDLTYN